MAAGDTSNASAVISAVSGIAGVLAGSLITTFKEVILAAFARERDRRYLAVVVSSHLDRFSRACLAVSYDDGTDEGRPAGKDGVTHDVVVPAPKLELLGLEVNWKSLEPRLLGSVLVLPDRLDGLKRSLTGPHFEQFPEHTEFFLTRRCGYAALGLEASDVAVRLRHHATLPEDYSDSARMELRADLEEAYQIAQAELARYEERRRPLEF